MTELVLVAVLALAIGALTGWLAASRRTSSLASDLAVAQSRAADAELVRQARDAVEAERNEAQRDLAAFRAQATERDAAHARAIESLNTQFATAADKALEAAQTRFLERADARFKQSEELTGRNLKSMLQPVSERLQRYEEAVGKVEIERQGAFDQLKGQLEGLRVGQEKVSSEAAKLVNSLRNAPKSRGRWGEQQLKNVLETCGLSEHTDFQTEVSVAGDDGARLRPDAIVRVPGGRSLVIDAKVSLNAYQDAFGAVDEDERTRGLNAHAASMRAHVNGLGNKAYWSQFKDAPDYVIMFVPGEHFLSAALEHDPTLWDFAFEKRVLLATPTNLIAIARTVDAVWRQEKMAKQAQEIGALGKEMHDRLAVAAEHMRVVGGGLSTAVKRYNDFVGSFERNVLSTGRKFKELNIESTAKEIPELPPVEALARYGEGPTLLAANQGDAAE
ncbi:DNA recombination protein RmuC [Sphingomonas oligophenolica]|uniref:DNA recombination protein RmuC homolog n=1 Tax=Sphingomonas oligophenolica TaxID=301154 RepID=A0A502CL86_9SPHN|nr:DNA recombination protein RmuC [Sphingomonas oligophenolica]TPG14425.1 DNA recombination protein RmuC [Sphingomonas oligophenolica]